MPDFESPERRAAQRLRQDARAGGPQVTVVGFEDDEGQPRPLIGDDEAPYVGALGRATETPSATDPGVPAVKTGQNQRLLTDAFGRLVVLSAAAPAELPAVANLIPQAGTVPALLVSAVPAELVEAWCGDYQSAAQRFFLLFDRATLPPAGAPAVASIQINSGWADYDFVAVPLAFTIGIVIALSSTPNTYTALAASTDYALTARFRVS